jgi:hypothetical protein
MQMRKYAMVALLVSLAGSAMAGDEGKPPTEGPAAKTHAALSGAAFIGVYKRDNSPYTLDFGADGKLVDYPGFLG